MLENIILIIIGFVLLVKGADFLIKGANGIAKKFHISEMLIGIIIMGIGTSLPEIVITIKSAIDGYSDIIIGNSIGSSICNFLLVLGIASIFKPLKIDERIAQIHLPIAIISVAFLFLIGNFGLNIINRFEGVILLFITVLYMIYSFFDEKRKQDEQIKTKQNQEKFENKRNTSNLNIENKENLKKELTNWQIVIYIIIGIIFLKYGADFVVDKSIEIAKMYNISELIISMTIIAIGTALPEIVTSTIATIKKEADLAIGNIVGSNIFNLALLPGIGAIINPINYESYFNRNLVILLMIIFYIILLNKIGEKDVINRKKGIFLILIYITYIINLVL